MGVGPRRCKCQAIGVISLGSTGKVEVNICPDCFLMDSYFSLEINDTISDYSFVSDSIALPICRGDNLVTHGSGNLSGMVSGKGINGTVNFEIDVSSNSVGIKFKGGVLGNDSINIGIVGIGVPVYACGPSGVIPLAKNTTQITAESKIIVTLSYGNTTKQIMITE